MVDRMSRLFGSMTMRTSLERARVSIAQAGLTGKVTPLQISTLSYFLMFLVPFMSLSFTGIPPSLLSYQSAILVIAIVLGYRLPYGYVQGKAQARKHEIRKALPFTLDLISISVEAGMALDGAMAIVQEKSTGPMADELGLTLREIRLGKGRNEALVDMGNRIGLEELKSFVTAVTYIARLGGSLVDVIRIQAQGHAHQAPPARGGKGHENTGQDHDPAGAFHLPFDVHRHSRACRHYHGGTDEAGAGTLITRPSIPPPLKSDEARPHPKWRGKCIF